VLSFEEIGLLEHLLCLIALRPYVRTADDV